MINFNTLRDGELTAEQLVDLSILLSLKTEEEFSEWAEAVGSDDVHYGLSLLTVARLKMVEALDVPRSVKGQTTKLIKRISSKR